MKFLLGLKTPEDSYLQHFHNKWNFAKLWRKKSRLGTWNFRRIIIPQKSPTVVVQIFYFCWCLQKNRSARHARECSQRPFVTPKKQPSKRGKRAVHFWCFCIKMHFLKNRHATTGNTNSKKLSWLTFFRRDLQKIVFTYKIERLIESFVTLVWID